MTSCAPVPEATWPISVGLSVLLIGVVGVFYPLARDKKWKQWEEHKEPYKNWELAFFGAVLIALTWVEWKSINAQEEHQRLQQEFGACVQQRDFEDTAKGLKENLKVATDSLSKAQEAAEAARSSFERATEGVAMETGGNSFPYVDFAENMESASLKKVGKNPLYNLTLTFIDANECLGVELGFSCKPSPPVLGDLTIPEMNIEPPYWNTGGPKLDLTTIGDADTQRLLRRSALMLVDMSARNGHWREYFWVGSRRSRLGGLERIVAIRVYRVLLDSEGKILGHNMIWERIDKDFPREGLTFDLLDFGAKNVYWKGKRVHVASIEEGGVKASRLESDKKRQKVKMK